MCAVSTSHVVYLVDPTSDPDVSIGSPSSTTNACYIGENDPFLIATDTSGHVFLYNDDATWSTISGLSVSQMSGVSKATVIATDQAGHHPYHWNVYAGYIGASTTGQWTGGCPGPGNICNPNATHTGHLQVKFPHSLNGTMQNQTIPYNGSMNLTAWDANPNCDLLFGNPSDPECQVTASGNEHCDQSGANLGNVSEPGFHSSEDWVTWNGSQALGMTGATARGYKTTVQCGINHACVAGTSAKCQIQTINGTVYGGTYAGSRAGAAIWCESSMPWSVTSAYDPNADPVECLQLIQSQNVPIPGDCY